VIGDEIDLRGRHLHFRRQTVDYGSRKRIKENLPDDAVRAETRLFVLGRQMQKAADHVAHARIERSDRFVNDYIHRWCRFSKFVCKDAEVPVAEVEAAQAFEPGFDDGAQDYFGWSSLIEGRSDRVEAGGAHRLPDNFGIQPGFVSEVIINSGDVGAGALADLSDSGVVKTQLSKHFSGRVNQTRARLIAGYGLNGHSNGRLKRLFEYVKGIGPIARIGPIAELFLLGGALL